MTQTIEVPAGAVALPLRNRAKEVVAWILLDEADLPVVDGRSLSLMTNGYARCNQGLLHRLLMGVTDRGLDVDHINRNRLDNRRSNLRVVTHAQNHQNRNGLSGKRGVSFNKKRGKWKAQHGLNYKTFHIGYFDSEQEADDAARAWRAVHMPYAQEEAA